MVNTEITLAIFFAAKDREALYRQQKQDWKLTVEQTDHELFIAKFRHKLNKVGKMIRSSRHDLNQIPYHYTVEVTNRLKGLVLIERLKDCGQRFVTLYRR